MPPKSLPNGLTSQQEAFALAYVEMRDATKAYRTAYKIGENTKPQTVWRSAKSVLDKPKVAARIAELRKPAAEAAAFTLTDHLQTLAEIRDKAIAKGKFSAAAQAEHYRGRAAGFYVDKAEIKAKIEQTYTFTAIINGPDAVKTIDVTPALPAEEEF